YYTATIPEAPLVPQDDNTTMASFSQEA
ncbi:hypothetical protein PENANT_c237G07006, partial [Penicillium antarcticum]